MSESEAFERRIIVLQKTEKKKKKLGKNSF